MLSDQNDLKGLYSKLAEINPRKYLQLLQKDDTGYDKLMAQMLIQQMKQNNGTQADKPGEKAPSGYRFTNDGGLKPIPGGPADKPDKKEPMSFAEKTAIKNRFTTLGKAEEKALEAVPKVQQYDAMIKALERGDVGGVEGGVKAFLAPVAESLGLDPNGKMGEAQGFKLMARAMVAGMRLQLIGPGPMSDAEQKLLAQLSGGDVYVARAAARDLFKLYRSKAANDIKNYHKTYDLLNKKYPEIKDTFMRFDDEVGGDSTGEAKPTQSMPERSITGGVNFVQGAKTKEEAQKRYKQLLDPSKKWSKEELKRISDTIDYSRWK